MIKKAIAFLLMLPLLASLAACHSHESGDVAFYYQREPGQYRYFEDDSVICVEYRDLTGHRSDLQYMAGLYLAGPMEEGLLAPFNKNTRLISIRQDGSLICVELSDHTQSLSDSEFSLSCACLALTCMDYTTCDAVSIVSAGRTITMTRDDLVLIDPLPWQETNGG